MLRGFTRLAAGASHCPCCRRPALLALLFPLDPSCSSFSVCLHAGMLLAWENRCDKLVM